MYLIILSILGGGTFAFLGECMRRFAPLYEDCAFMAPWSWFFYVAAGLFPFVTIIKYIAWRVRSRRSRHGARNRLPKQKRGKKC